jgi:hypothetical protein
LHHENGATQQHYAVSDRLIVMISASLHAVCTFEMLSSDEQQQQQQVSQRTNVAALAAAAASASAPVATFETVLQCQRCSAAFEVALRVPPVPSDQAIEAICAQVQRGEWTRK